MFIADIMPAGRRLLPAITLAHTVQLSYSKATRENISSESLNVSSHRATARLYTLTLAGKARAKLGTLKY
jgi:hypothetical protein